MRGNLALLCQLDGTVIEILQNDYAPRISIERRTLFPALVDAAEFKTVLEFLSRIRETPVLFDIPFAINNGTDKLRLYFSAIRAADKIILAGSESQGDMSSALDALAKINQALARQLRQTFKQNYLRTKEHDDEIYNDFSRLNNELANTKRELSKSNAQLTLLNEQKNELLGIAAHDMRSPLTAILGYVKFVLGTRNDSLNDAQVQMLERVVGASEKMLHMLEALLDISQLEAGKLTLSMAPFNLCKMVRDNIELNTIIALKKNIRIELKLPDKDIILSGDEGKLDHVLNNFVSNAVKYSHPGTRVRVEVWAENNRAYCSIADQGQGIPEQELDKLFIPFSKISVQSTAGERRTGMGLAIGKKVIAGHHGCIRVQSQVGVGSTFIFELPLH